MDRKLIRHIKKNFEYQEYLDDQDVHTLETNRPDEIRICCPRCGEGDYKCYVNDEKKTFCCFKCGFGHFGSGDLFDFVAAVEDLPVSVAFHRVCAEYADLARDTLAIPEAEEKQQPALNAFEIKTIQDLPFGVFPMEEDDEDAEPFFEYLVCRGLTLAEIIGMRTHYTSAFSYVKTSQNKKIKLRDRVLWPVYGGKGDLVSWISRIILDEPGEKCRKYINAPESELAKTFWPYSPLPQVKKEAVLCEGILDALAIRRAGYFSFACFGKRLSKEQVMLLKHWGAERLTVFFDRDAKREMVSAVDSLRMQFQSVHVVDVSSWPPKQDSGALLAHPNGTAILQQALEHSIDVDRGLAYSRWRVT